MTTVTLNWKDLNYGESEQRVYRSTATIDPENLGTPLATLGADVTSYIDTTVVDQETYYYRVSAVVNGTEYVSDEVSAFVDEPAILWLNDGSTLSGWTVTGATVDSGAGNPAPSLRTNPNTYARLAPLGAGVTWVGKSIKFDARVTGTGGLCDLFFCCNSSGDGQLVRVEARAGTFSGISDTASWTSWSIPRATFPPADTAWHTYQVDIKTGPVADVWKDGTKVLADVTIAILGDYIGIHGDGGNAHTLWDNLSIFNTA